MKKLIIILGFLILSAGFVFAQSDKNDFHIPTNVDFSDNESSSEEDELFGGEDELFGSEDDLFGSEDDLFSDDGIEEIDTTAKDDLAKGVIFESGAVTVGGSLKAGIDTNTMLYNPDEDDFGKNLKNTKLIPRLGAFLSVDARPTETLRIYTKFGMSYPFSSNVILNLSPQDMAFLSKFSAIVDGNGKDVITDLLQSTNNGANGGAGNNSYIEGGKLNQDKIKEDIGKLTNPDDNKKPETTEDKNKEKKNQDILNDLQKKISVKDWFTLKELFTDFSIKDRAFFRFGLHTVSWGTGYFFSPVSDMINTSQIDPENPTEQVSGSLNLRTQIVFPGTQNCLWLYVIPSTDFAANSVETYAKDTAFAAKGDIVLGGWELGIGGFWRYEDSPKAMLTASGSIKKLSLFGEMVYQYGSKAEWAENTDKTSIFYGTLGGFYMWKNPGIMVGAQYYYDSNEKDLMNRIYTNGHNIALMANFSKLGNAKSLSASIFGIVNFGRKGFSDEEKALMKQVGNNMELPCLMVNANLIYRPIDDISLSIGPSLTFSDFEKEPTVSLKIGATLGGGKF